MDLSEWRNEIDQIDREIMQLLKRRAAVVAKIGKQKAAAGLPIIDEERERQIMSRIENNCDATLPIEAASCIFRCIIEESRRIQLSLLT